MPKPISLASTAPFMVFTPATTTASTATIPAHYRADEEAGKTYEPVTYEGAGHGFMRAGEEPIRNERKANKKARDEAWERWKELLKKVDTER